MPTIAVGNIPGELADLLRWVIWRRERRDDKWTKVPYCARRPDHRASSTDETTWAPFHVAVGASAGADGIGFVFREGDGLTGIDLDKACNPDTGQIAPWALEIVTMLASYTERTPSLTGLHILARGNLPPGPRRKGQIEMYDEARYFTVTGWHVAGTPKAVERRPAELAALHARLFPPAAPPAARPVAPSSPTPRRVITDGADMLTRARNARNGAKFERLWGGDAADYGGDQSAADLALCEMLAFWTSRNAIEMERMFRQSGLMRHKWDERHYSDGRTYGQGTIQRAIANAREVYDPDRPPILVAARALLPWPSARTGVRL